jgi:hypothetical protein
MSNTKRWSIGILAAFVTAALVGLTGCSSSAEISPVELSSSRPSLLFFYTEH